MMTITMTALSAIAETQTIKSIRVKNIKMLNFYFVSFDLVIVVELINDF